MPRKLPPNCYDRNGVLWGRIKVAGREYRGSLRTADPAEARRRLKAWRLKLERAAVGDEESPTFKAAVVKWAREVLPGSVKPSVAKRYMVSIGQMVDHFGALRISEITPGMIGSYISTRAGKASNATIRRDLTALSRLLASCTAWGWRQDNPARFFDRSIIRERRDPIRPPADEDVATVIAAAPPGMARILRLLSQTGMRENEAVTLARGDVDWPGCRIRLLRTKTNRPRTLEWRTPGGDAGGALKDAPGVDVLFPAETGEAYRSFSANFGRVIRGVEAREKAAGRPFRRFRVHDLRHGFAIRWLRNGGGIYELSLHLGHTSVKTTEGYLGHLSARERAVAQKGAQQVEEVSVDVLEERG